MPNTPAQWSQSMLATLAVSLPQMSFAIGTPERKIVDALGEALAEVSVSQYLTGSMLDIDTLSGMQLEQFVGLFGFGRLAGIAASGVVTVTLNAAQTTASNLDLGTQFYTTPGLAGIATQLYYSSTQAVVVPVGTTIVEVPVQCTTVGANGNVPPDSVTYLANILGSSSATNLSAMTGGVDPETDAELRQRFKDTFLRNVAGTADWYTALAQQNSNVSRATVFGPTALYATQLVAPSTSPPATLFLPTDVAYIWPGETSCFTGLGTDSEVFYSAVDDYTLSSGAGNEPTFTTLADSQIVPGTIVDLEFQYTSAASRNSPATGIYDKVDLFVEGTDPFTVQEQCRVTIGTPTKFVSTSGTNFYTGNFVRIETGVAPSTSNYFMQLGSVPIISFPSVITYGSSSWTEGVHWYRVQDTTKRAGSQYEVSGIEWVTGTNPGDGTLLTLNYVYNQVPETLSAVVQTSKQITTDVMVHQAPVYYFNPCVNIEYDRSYSVSTVNSAIATRLQVFFQSLGFGAWIHTSSMMLAIQQVLGVVSVSMTTEGTPTSSNPGQDPVNYGVLQYASSDTTTFINQVGDFKLPDQGLAAYYGFTPIRLATS